MQSIPKSHFGNIGWFRISVSNLLPRVIPVIICISIVIYLGLSNETKKKSHMNAMVRPKCKRNSMSHLDGETRESSTERGTCFPRWRTQGTNAPRVWQCTLSPANRYNGISWDRLTGQWKYRVYEPLSHRSSICHAARTSKRGTKRSRLCWWQPRPYEWTTRAIIMDIPGRHSGEVSGTSGGNVESERHSLVRRTVSSSVRSVYFFHPWCCNRSNNCMQRRRIECNGFKASKLEISVACI